MKDESLFRMRRMDDMHCEIIFELFHESKNGTGYFFTVFETRAAEIGKNAFIVGLN